MAVAKNQTAKTAATAAKKAVGPATRRSSGTSAGTSAEARTSAKAAESAPPPAEAATSAQAPAASSEESGKRITVTIPLDSSVLGVAVKAATLPVTAVKKVAQNKNGLPAYAAVGGLAVLGAVEWPVVAVGGLGLAALRRWGPLKPEPDKTAK